MSKRRDDDSIWLHVGGPILHIQVTVYRNAIFYDSQNISTNIVCLIYI